MTSRSQVDAITSRTLSSEDMAAANIATSTKAAGNAGRISALPRSVGTTRSESVRPLPNTPWAYRPIGMRIV